MITFYFPRHNSETDDLRKHKSGTGSDLTALKSYRYVPKSQCRVKKSTFQTSDGALNFVSGDGIRALGCYMKTTHSRPKGQNGKSGGHNTRSTSDSSTYPLVNMMSWEDGWIRRLNVNTTH